MSPQRQSQKVPTDKELDEFEKRKNPQPQAITGSLGLPPQYYEQAPASWAPQSEAPRRDMKLVAALIGALIVLIVGAALILIVVSRVR